MGEVFGRAPSSWLFPNGAPSTVGEGVLALDFDTAVFKLGQREIEEARDRIKRANGGR